MSICKNKYEISLEYSGSYALFSDPKSGSEKVSYVAPTKTAVRGIIQSIYYMKAVKVEPYKTEIMNPLNMEDFKFNSRTLLRKSPLITSENAAQITYRCLKNVRYRSYAWVSNLDPEEFKKHMSDRALEYEKKKVNHAHAFQSQFNRRLKRGRYYRMPSLGLKKFSVDDFGPIVDSSEKPICLTMNIGPMLEEIFDNHVNGKVLKEPIFSENKQIKNGVLHYA